MSFSRRSRTRRAGCRPIRITVAIRVARVESVRLTLSPERTDTTRQRTSEWISRQVYSGKFPVFGSPGSRRHSRAATSDDLRSAEVDVLVVANETYSTDSFMGS